jgi:hypothetical protein
MRKLKTIALAAVAVLGITGSANAADAYIRATMIS